MFHCNLVLSISVFSHDICTCSNMPENKKKQKKTNQNKNSLTYSHDSAHSDTSLKRPKKPVCLLPLKKACLWWAHGGWTLDGSCKTPLPSQAGEVALWARQKHSTNFHTMHKLKQYSYHYLHVYRGSQVLIYLILIFALMCCACFSQSKVFVNELVKWPVVWSCTCTGPTSIVNKA